MSSTPNQIDAGTDSMAPPSAQTAQWRFCKRQEILLVVFVFATLVTIHLAGEKIPVNGGLGWDGKTYALIARDFGSDFVKGKLTQRWVRRALPSVVIHGC